MLKSYILTLHEYNVWANARIMAQVEKLSTGQFLEPLSPTHPSFRETLLHVLAAEWIWRQRCQEGVSPTALFDGADFPTLQSIQTLWAEERQKLMAYVAALDETALASHIAYQTTGGRPMQDNLGEILIHVVMHGMQHRGELAMRLTDYGHSPGEIDLIRFAQARDKRS